MSTPDLLENMSNSDDFSYQKQIISSLMEQLFPICRSITGSGVRKSLNILKGISDFKIFEIPSGTKCFDWEVPDEWNIEDAFIEDSKGNKIVDFQKNNLHVVNYSVPINETLTFTKLKPKDEYRFFIISTSVAKLFSINEFLSFSFINFLICS